VLNFINLRKYVSLKPVGHYDIKQHLKPILILFAQVVAVNIYTNLDNVMLGFMKTDVDVGLYAAAVKVKTILTSLVTSLGAVLLPRLSYYIMEGRKKEFQTLIRKAYNFVIVIALPLMLFTIFYARDA
jgi:O-antigen/teichoic acid export membrane protein